MFICAFLYVGFVCLIAQIIMDNTKLTPGHVTSLFVVIGAILGFFGLYDIISSWSMAGASIPIISFGNMLYEAGWYGYRTGGLLGIFTNFLTTTSAGITGVIVFSFFFALFFNPKD